MGYRSDVAYMIKFSSPEDYWGFIAESKCDPDTTKCWEDDFESFKQNDKLLAIQFACEGVKWYDDYEDVKCHMSLWEKARDRRKIDNISCDGYYARIGEDLDDIDERNFGNDPPFDYVCVERSIKVNWENT